MKPTRARHVVLWLTVAVYMITYMDRGIISAAAPMIKADMKLDTISMGWILGAFRAGYTMFQIPGGWFGDIVGPRRGLTLIVAWWSLFTSLTALSWSSASMIVCRFLFGVGEGGAFPTATRSLSRWMLPQERAYAQGITHAGSRLGAFLTPLIVVPLITAFGWRTPFFIFGALGLVWAAVWYFYYRDTPDTHRGVNAAELAIIQKGLGSKQKGLGSKVPWKQILSSPTLWVLFAMYYCYSHCLAIYLDWFPTYLTEHRGYSLKQMGIYASLPLLAGVFGDLLGGVASDYLVHRTGNLNLGRRSVAITGFLLAACSIIPATLTKDAQTCVALTCLGVFGLEFTVGVSWAIPLDIGADYAGSVSAIMNTANMGGAISTTVAAYMVKAYGWEMPFLVAAAMCVIGAMLFWRIDATKKIFANP